MIPKCKLRTIIREQLVIVDFEVVFSVFYFVQVVMSRVKRLMSDEPKKTLIQQMNIRSRDNLVWKCNRTLYCLCCYYQGLHTLKWLQLLRLTHLKMIAMLDEDNKQPHPEITGVFVHEVRWYIRNEWHYSHCYKDRQTNWSVPGKLYWHAHVAHLSVAYSLPDTDWLRIDCQSREKVCIFETSQPVSSHNWGQGMVA